MRPPTSKYYDQDGKRLVYVRQRADATYWDEHWASRREDKTRKTHGGNRFYSEMTRRYVPSGACILEGGCGLGDKVYSLQSCGFDAFGVDFAAEALRRAKGSAPDLKLCVGDIRSLCYRDEVFDGYWSIGAIEHFYSGFEPIAAEMHRVLRKGAYLFLTFPAMSPLRRTKALLSFYPAWDGATASEPVISRFYQFALSARIVARTFDRRFGFRLVRRQYRGGLQGLREELPGLAPLLDRLSRSRRRPMRLARKILQRLATPVAAHTVLLVLQKR